MTTIDMSYVASPSDLPARFRRAFRRLRRRVAAPAPPEDARARRAFVQEMLSRNPGAFSSELGVQFMMQHFPRSF
jgi:hypothetical protein